MTPRPGLGPRPARRRGRSIARTAVVGGAAYHAGKSRGAAQEPVQEQPAYEQQPAPAPAPAPQPAATDVTVELQKLADLKASGALTDEEFAAAKAQILG